jgi:GDP-L-fucose synthase
VQAKKHEYLVLGSRGLVGSAVVRQLISAGKDFYAATRADADITDAISIDSLISNVQPRVVIAAAARVGGLIANHRYPVEFLEDNVVGQTFLMRSAHKHDVERFVFLGSSCIYPRDAKQPISESSLLTGELEVTNEAYAIAKIAGLKLVQSYRREYGRKWISVMPTNLFGINDNFDLETSHALPALMRKFHEAKVKGQPSVELWGSGKPQREFMFSDDFAEALLFVIDRYDSDEPINIGTGTDISIRDLSDLMIRVTRYEGGVNWNQEIPDGTFRKLLDSSKLAALGWKSGIDLEKAVQETYNWFKSNYGSARLSVQVK